MALIGSNGAGKSTLMKLMVGLLKPQAGTVSLFGEAIGDKKAEDLSRQISLVYQNPEEMFIKDSIRADIAYAMEVRNIPEWKRRTVELLDRFRLTELQDRDGRLMSGGQMRRASLAIGIALNPGILLLDEQLKQNSLLQEDLGRTHKQVADYIANGIATLSDLDAVSVEQLNTRQHRVELETTRRAYLSMLAAFTDKDLSSETVLLKPAAEENIDRQMNNRPELRWYDAQGEQLRQQEAALNTRLMPRFGLFVQGAYGNPGLNMLKDEFNAYYMAGVRMSWNFGSLYTLKNDRRRIDNTRQQIETGRDVFLFNIRLQATQQDAGIVSMRRQMADDDEIIRLRGNIRRAAEAKVQNGTMTVTDMLREITNESMARQTKALHEVQLLMNIWQLKYTLNN